MNPPGKDVTCGTTVTGLLVTPPSFTEHGGAALVLAVGGPAAGARVVVDDSPKLLGSGADADAILADPQVSRRHVKLEWRDSKLRVSDLQSKNGSFYDDERFDKVELSYGDTFRIGSTTLKVLPDERAVEPSPADGEAYGALVGRSRAIRQLFTLIDRIADSEFPVLIEGETGVGKELVAEEIHRNSTRRDRPFIVFDCGAVPGELIESALFGHLKGSFTGATADRAGVFAEADGGTIFLDEIGELRPDLQPSLLRVLDRGMIRRVGETRFRTVDVRVVAATHRNLSERIQAGSFREDLYYRLAVVRLSVPALRERPEDIELLCRHFLRKLGRADLFLDAPALELLRKRPWPGNVRELRNVIARGVALSSQGIFALDAPDVPAPAVSPGDVDQARPVSLQADGTRKPFRDAKAQAIDAVERAYLSELMRDHDNLTSAAKDAEMDRKHLRVLLRRHELLD